MEWPNILPVPSKDGYSYKPEACVLRTQMEGKRRIRKVFTKQPYIFNITLRCTDKQLAVFEYFWKNELNSGLNWFDMPLTSGKGISTVTARFMDEPDINTDGRYWRVSGSIEIEELPLYSETEYNDAIGEI